MIAILLSFVLHLSVTGRRTYATGANGLRRRSRASRPSGSGSAPSCSAPWRRRGRHAADRLHRAGEAGVGTPYLFLTIAAVLVGGTSLVGARGDYWRTVLGALILTLITTLLVGHGAGEATQEILFGVLILVFVGVYGRDQRVRDRV